MATATQECYLVVFTQEPGVANRIDAHLFEGLPNKVAVCDEAIRAGARARYQHDDPLGNRHASEPLLLRQMELPDAPASSIVSEVSITVDEASSGQDSSLGHGDVVLQGQDFAEDDLMNGHDDALADMQEDQSDEDSVLDFDAIVDEAEASADDESVLDFDAIVEEAIASGDHGDEAGGYLDTQPPPPSFDEPFVDSSHKARERARTSMVAHYAAELNAGAGPLQSRHAHGAPARPQSEYLDVKPEPVPPALNQPVPGEDESYTRVVPTDPNAGDLPPGTFYVDIPPEEEAEVPASILAGYMQEHKDPAEAERMTDLASLLEALSDSEDDSG